MSTSLWFTIVRLLSYNAFTPKSKLSQKWHRIWYEWHFLWIQVLTPLWRQLNFWCECGINLLLTFSNSPEPATIADIQIWFSYDCNRMVDFMEQYKLQLQKKNPHVPYGMEAPPPLPLSSLDDTSELTFSGKMPGRIITDNNVVSSGWRSTVPAKRFRQ